MISQPNFQTAISAMSFMPPEFRLAEGMTVVKTIRDFEKLITEQAVKLRVWRSKATANFRDGSTAILGAARHLPAETIRSSIMPQLNEAMTTLDELVETYSVPFHEGNRLRMDKVRALASADAVAFRYVRKQLDRLEDVRIENHNALIDMRYGLLGLVSEIENILDPTPAPTFKDGEALSNFLSSVD